MQQTAPGMRKCLFCDFESQASDFEEDFTHHAGVWCPNCDSFNLFGGDEERSRIYTLCVEDTENGQVLTEKKAVPGPISPLRYPGGKSWLAPYIAAMLSGTVTRFVEPFAGGHP